MFDTAAIKELADILTVAEDIGIPIKNENSKRPQILCPAHPDKNFGSAFLDLKRNTFHCYSCGAKGDVFDLVQAASNVSFTEAVKIVAESCGGLYQFQLDEMPKEMVSKITIISKPDQIFLGLYNTAIYNDIAFIPDEIIPEDYLEEPLSYYSLERDYNAEGYVVKEKMVSNPLYELFKEDENFYHTLIENFCIKKLKFLKKIMLLSKNSADKTDELTKSLNILKRFVPYSDIVSVLTEQAHRVREISQKHGTYTREMLNLVDEIETEEMASRAMTTWRLDGTAPF